MFERVVFALSTHARSGVAQLVSEFVATFGLLVVIRGTARSRPMLVPFAVGAYITAAYWFTASTSFANPAVTLARALTDTFSGIRPADAPGFVLAQLGGAAAATAFFRWLVPHRLQASVVAASRNRLRRRLRDGRRPLRLRPQRGPVPDGGGILQPAERIGAGASRIGRNLSR
jgi:hypothetical protein